MKKQFNFRIDEDLLIKIQYISDEEERTVSQEITYILRKYILKYEKENGEIVTKS